MKLVLINSVPEGLSRRITSPVSLSMSAPTDRIWGTGWGEYMYRHGLKNYGVIVHNADFYATNQRDNAAKQVLAEEYPDLRLCGEVRFENEGEVYRKTRELIKRYPEIEASTFSWDGPAIESIEALTELGRTDIAISTGDLDYAVAMNMAKGAWSKPSAPSAL